MRSVERDKGLKGRIEFSVLGDFALAGRGCCTGIRALQTVHEKKRIEHIAF